MFNYIVGFSITEYVRNRRLTIAAFELLDQKTTVTETALKYGYDSPVSFTRAFRSFHGVSPSEARRKKTKLKAFPRLSFKIQITGDKEMNYRIEEKKEFKAFGIEKEFPYDGDDMQIPNFFTECIKDGSFDALRKISRKNHFYVNMPTVSGIGCGKRRQDNLFTYMIGTLIFNNEKIPAGYAQKIIPAHTWAVFESEHFQDGKDDDIKIIRDLWQRIFMEWLPLSSFELADTPGIEQDYFDNPQDCYVEIWVPISKQK